MEKEIKLLNFANDTRKLRSEINRRLKKVSRSLNELCKLAKVEVSTVWRWSKGSKPNTSTINRIELVLVKWEKELAAFMN